MQSTHGRLPRFAMKKEEVDKRYLNRNKVLCRYAGVWPYQANISRNLARTFAYTVALTSLFTMILRMIVFFSPDILIEQCPFLVAACGIIFKLANYSLKYDELKGLMNGMYNDWDIKRPPAEIEIMDVYGKRGVLFTMVYIVTAMFGAVVFIMMPTVAGIVEYFLRSENGTVHRYYIYPAYYPFDEDRYFIYFWAHMTTTICVVVIVYTACDALYLYGVQHACGLLAVAGYRFKSAVENYAYDEKDSVKMMDMAYKNVCSSIHGHKRALRYGGQWYNSSRKTQMLYLLALRRTLTAPVLSAGGLLPLTLETFAEVLKVSVSYFTVLKSQ